MSGQILKLEQFISKVTHFFYFHWPQKFVPLLYRCLRLACVSQEFGMKCAGFKVRISLKTSIMVCVNVLKILCLCLQNWTEEVRTIFEFENFILFCSLIQPLCLCLPLTPSDFALIRQNYTGALLFFSTKLFQVLRRLETSPCLLGPRGPECLRGCLCWSLFC